MINEHRFLVNFKKYKFLLNQLVKRDIKIRYRRSVLGIFWSFLEPLLTMIVLTIVFSTLFKGWGIENYPVYLLTGRLIFTFLYLDLLLP
jgi:lipopolysaccharide transport system permease protein